MKNIVKFIIFIAYTIAIFQINNFFILCGLVCLNTMIALILKIRFKDFLHSLEIFLPFVLFTVIVNIIFANLQEGILIGIRILICYYITYLYAKTTTIFEIANTIEKIFYPLKLFKIDIKQIGMIVSIALCMIPVLKNEISTLVNTMESRGKKLQINHMIIILKPMFISILRKTNEMEKTLIGKGIQ